MMFSVDVFSTKRMLSPTMKWVEHTFVSTFRSGEAQGPCTQGYVLGLRCGSSAHGLEGLI